MKKKRNKKYNSTLKYQQISRIVAKDYMILDITAIDVFVYYKGSEIKPKSFEARMLNEVRYKWQIMAGVICRDQLKREYLKTDTFITANEYFTSELSDYLAEFQADLWETANPLHRLTQFWLATPNKTEITEQVVMKMINSKKGFNNFMTVYEYQQSKVTF
ncbi:hypothetical protein [Gilliamella sp. Pas-s25]|uniref:hypothetical protein n=1 Tax=Gilliamella sp. Pas-s25 TaxID=2687310 RepID=UPI00135EF279|nr:hypothetical protein [Gilliamella sp. Pas-s25]MWP61091.1 hypothetical protein [Gilliamella sp. Pas-s25]